MPQISFETTEEAVQNLAERLNEVEIQLLAYSTMNQILFGILENQAGLDSDAVTQSMLDAIRSILAGRIDDDLLNKIIKEIATSRSNHSAEIKAFRS